MKLKDWLKLNRSKFSDSDLRFLIKNTFSQSNCLAFEEDTFLTSETEQYLEKIKQSYLRGMPLAYILGKEDFFGWEFKVDNNVLIPRKETELIVEKAIKIIDDNNLRYVLDLCCGCANIAVSIKKAISNDLFIASSDISFKALLISKTNSKIHKANIKLINSDLLTAFKHNAFDLIISNPPYVEKDCIKGSLSYEPRLALEAGDDGLVFIKKILLHAHHYLKDKGYFLMEMGYKDKDCVDKLIRKIDSYEIIEWIKDYSGNDRGVVLRKSRG